MNFYVSRNNENICLVYWFLFYFLGIPYNFLFSNSSFFFFLKHLGTHLLTVTFFLSCYTPMEELLYHCSNLIYWSSCASYKDPFCFVHTNYSNLCEYIFFFPKQCSYKSFHVVDVLLLLFQFSEQEQRPIFVLLLLGNHVKGSLVSNS